MKRLEGTDRRAAGLVALWIAGAGLVGGPVVASRIENSLEDRVAEHVHVQEAESAGATISVNGRTAHVEPGSLSDDELAALMDQVANIDGIRSVKLDLDAGANAEVVASEDVQGAETDDGPDPEVASVTQVPQDASGAEASTTESDQTNAGGQGVDGDTTTSFVDTSLIAAPTITQLPETGESTTESTTTDSATTDSATTDSATTDSATTDSATTSPDSDPASDGSSASDSTSGNEPDNNGLAGGRTLTDDEQADLQIAAGELERLLGTQNIEFVFSTAIPTEATQDLLIELIELMEDNDVLELHIVGHTDTIGNAAANQQLSLDRAQSIANHLIIGGIDSARMTVEGRGASDPVAGNETGAGKQHNRRVVIEAKGLKL